MYIHNTKAVRKPYEIDKKAFIGNIPTKQQKMQDNSWNRQPQITTPVKSSKSKWCSLNNFGWYISS